VTNKRAINCFLVLCVFFFAVPAAHSSLIRPDRPVDGAQFAENIRPPKQPVVTKAISFDLNIKPPVTYSLQFDSWDWGGLQGRVNEKVYSSTIENDDLAMEWVKAISVGVASTSVAFLVLLVSGIAG